jgi:hypothetical protein
MARDMAPEAEATTGEFPVVADKASATQAVRERWIAELRRQGDRQCEGDLSRGNNVCALGLLAEVAGLSSSYQFYGDIADAAGLDGNQLEEVWRRNDGCTVYTPTFHKHTFAEIADVVEGWFK